MHYQQRERWNFVQEHKEDLEEYLCTLKTTLNEISAFRDPRVKAVTPAIERHFNPKGLLPFDPRPPKQKKASFPQKVTMEIPHPSSDVFPTHPNNWPQVTPKDVFNRHMAQAMTPYVLAIATKVAQDRNLAPPNEVVISKVLERVDWAKAAYEMREIGAAPPKSRMMSFLDKYIFNPLDKISDELFLRKLWPIFVSAGLVTSMYRGMAAYVDRYSNPASTIGGFMAQRVETKARYKTLKKLRATERHKSLEVVKALFGK